MNPINQDDYLAAIGELEIECAALRSRLVLSKASNLPTAPTVSGNDIPARYAALVSYRASLAALPQPAATLPAAPKLGSHESAARAKAQQDAAKAAADAALAPIEADAWAKMNATERCLAVRAGKQAPQEPRYTGATAEILKSKGAL